MDNVATLKTALPELPAGFDNRLGDNWRLMLGIADLAGGEWPDQARQTAIAVAKITESGMSVGVKLLADIKDIFASKGGRPHPLSRAGRGVGADRGSSVGGLETGKPITQNALALQLAPFAIVSGNIRVAHRMVKGYQVAQFRDAFERYL